MQELAGRVAVVTGANRGIGVYIVWALVKARMNLVLAARDAPALETVAAAARAAGVRAIAVPTDVTDAAARRALVDRALAEFGAVDVLVNNAGIEQVQGYHTLTAAQIEQMIAVNLTAPMLLTHLVLPGMLQRHSGHVVNVSSLAGKASPPYSEPYVATKAGLIGFSRSLRASYRVDGVSTSTIVPGFVAAGMGTRLKQRFQQGRGSPIGISSAQDVARAVVRAIRGDVAEIIVNPVPLRPALALSEMFPPLNDWITERSGAREIFGAIAATREGALASGGAEGSVSPS